MDTVRPDATGITLLYVEDEAEPREIVSRTLAGRYPGLTVLTADNGSQGLEVFREQHPDVVITDISMPVMDGLRMVRQMKEMEQDLLVAAMTAYNDTGYLLDAIEIGISHYIMKPVNYQRLFGVVDSALRDIGLRRRVREQNDFIRKLSRAVEQGPSMVVIADTDGLIEYVNNKFCEITGFAADEVVGKGLREFHPCGDRRVDCDGICALVGGGGEWHGEILNRKKGGERYWEMVSVSPLLGPDHVPTHLIMVKEDITERKQAEERIEELNTNLSAKAASLAAANAELETFSYSVSHDLRKPLTIINGYCQVIREICGDVLGEPCTGYLNEIYEGTMQMNQLIDALLNFSRLKHEELHREEMDLGEMARAVVAELRQAEPDRRVTVRIPDRLTVNGDPKLLRVVLENLLGNAWKYTGKKTEGLIELDAWEESDQFICFVRDNGAGFDMADAARLFVPFQRLPGAGEFRGHGIGLASVQRIVERHCGRVWAEGEPGKGATFYFTLPKLKDEI